MIPLSHVDTVASSPADDSPDPSAVRQVATASFIGNFVEWFDYASYGYLATVIAATFFTDSNPTVALLQTYAVFAMSFVLRPVGGIVWGVLGDRWGRRLALSWSILLMSGATFCIGLLPSQATLGASAPLLLLLLRMIQGFSASGEYAGASAFLAEYAPPGRRGLLTSIVPASTATGLLCGALTVTVLHLVMPIEDLHSWGWRIPFLIAGPLGLVGRYIRIHLEDSPHFRALTDQVSPESPKPTSRGPVREVLSEHRPAVAIAFGVSCLNAVAFYLVLSYMPTYLATELGVSRTEAFLASTISLTVYIAAIFAMGVLSDRFGRRRLLIVASVLFIVLTVPLFSLLPRAGTVGIVLIQVVFCVMLTVNDGTLPTFLAEIFPTPVRYTGFGLSFNTANALFGGTAPMIATWLIQVTGSPSAPAWYLTGVAVLALGAMAASRETAFDTLPDR
ncbi:MFS transporter, MHS family, proline/betaine transporter [Austwickia chelonae]|uniref:Putative proline/betaine transporter n=1 Tax=Austwickia chelonae NBRC 105200 TaxID=1184607 RepID=K6W4F1_9MICO|nr:MFS transporter [Austwickia chelonae]GAB76682.1 putative major facilitator superfamily transporter [Austwickia chelonae NBRC 105200]SEW29220.1 MFS transporter, MHS family, proline/betaine transporter [Austwickia chelonae]